MPVVSLRLSTSRRASDMIYSSPIVSELTGIDDVVSLWSRSSDEEEKKNSKRQKKFRWRQPRFLDGFGTIMEFQRLYQKNMGKG